MIDTTRCTVQLRLKTQTQLQSWSMVAHWLNQIWQQSLAHLCKGQELQVRQRRDRHGLSYWQAYEPKTGQFFSSGSLEDVQHWIEHSYRYTNR